MGEIKIKDKEIVVPGQVLAEGMDYLPTQGTFREEDDIVASQLGVAGVNGRLIKVIPLTGKYFPKKGDTIVGKIVDMSFSNWYLDVGCAYNATLPLKEVPEYVEKNADLSRYYNYDDYVCATINHVVLPKAIDLSMKGNPTCKKLIGGKIMEISPNKVPRVIGKQGSMVSMIKEITGCRIVVGQNGWVWLQNNDQKMILLASEAIKQIERDAHTEGLTDNIKAFLEKETKKSDKKETKKIETKKKSEVKKK